MKARVAAMASASSVFVAKRAVIQARGVSMRRMLSLLPAIVTVV
ncbi:hypothetical protein RS9917_09366 [Synechococcus sp. RS9917]|nr:hypothetical protein RS9917_09366 [Synechococcus sp. RS9917]